MFDLRSMAALHSGLWGVGTPGKIKSTITIKSRKCEIDSLLKDLAPDTASPPILPRIGGLGSESEPFHLRLRLA